MKVYQNSSPNYLEVADENHNIDYHRPNFYTNSFIIPYFLLQAVQRDAGECPICLTSLTKQGFVRNNSDFEKCNSIPNKKTPKGLDKKSKTDIHTTGIKDTALLSCTHVFHKTCIEAFEELAIGERSKSCPVCRSVYKKKVITM
jgi:hypothetical protein